MDVEPSLPLEGTEMNLPRPIRRLALTAKITVLSLLVVTGTAYAAVVTATPTLVYATVANGSERPLSGAVVNSGAVYVELVNVPKGASVTFSAENLLDAPRVERTAPYDLLGDTAKGHPVPLQVSALPNGAYTVSVIVRSSAGESRSSATFTVDKTAPLPTSSPSPSTTVSASATQAPPPSPSATPSVTGSASSTSTTPPTTAQPSPTASTTSSTPSPTAAATAPAGSLVGGGSATFSWSQSATRSPASALAGTTVSGTAYIFLSVSGGAADKVDFWLDSGTDTQPSQSESNAPYDLEGGTAELANALDTTRLANGTHRLTARVTQGGLQTLVTTSFGVSNGSIATATSAPVPSPTATATSTPQATLAFNPLTYDWAANAGAVAGTKALFNGGAYGMLEQDGVVHADKSITARQDVYGVDTGFRNSVFSDKLLVRSGRAVVERSTMNTGGAAVGGEAMVVRHSNITGNTDGLNPVRSSGTAKTVIEYNKIWRDGTRYQDKHHDGVQFWQGGDTTIRRNWISGWNTSAIMIKTDFGPINNVLIEENYLANPTGYFTMYSRDGGHGRPQMITVRNNVFGGGTPISPEAGTRFVRTEQERADAIARGDASARTWIVWYGNIDTSGRVVAPPGGWS
ncbi:right-handed parallel beta-helix repeat-containing protein [Aquipuribacter nitratireducens]|uniref:Right-handed parallel beta-helix repeat-containing protein n=1 Tax=Aquipuribacter nitratireducens TaxID=650104 RepID=A0ABW0GSY2_9MICO